MPREDYYPKELPSVSFWLSQQTPFSRHRSTAELPEEVDTVIIGSGFTGASVAHHLLKDAPDMKIAIYEARNVCSGATGRNGGHVKPFNHRNFDRHTKLLGEKAAGEIVNFEFDAVFELKRLVDEMNIDCDFILTRACDVYPYKNDPKPAHELLNYDKMMKSPYVRQDVKDQVQLFQGDAARMVSKCPDTEIAITYPAASCWPWKLVTALLKDSVSKGVNLQANTLVSDVVKREDGKWVVKTQDRGDTVCKNVVFAMNGYTKSLLDEFNGVVTPQRGIICRIDPKDKSTTPHLTHTYGILSEMEKCDYLINRADGSVIVGGQDDFIIDFEKKGLEALAAVYDNVDDTYFDKEGELGLNEEYMAVNFSTWRDTAVEVSHKWSGVMGYSKDAMPFVGGLECIGKKNCYISAGFHGHGMPRVFRCAKAVTQCILQETTLDKLPFICPRGFQVTKERLEAENTYEKYLVEYVKAHPQLFR